MGTMPEVTRGGEEVGFSKKAIIFMFLSCRPFVAITTLTTGLVGVEVTSVSWLLVLF